ncbi:hypothetical protein [Paenibacillus donghaensis]|uniref:Transcription initiation factor TFIIIB n=1 Tax=Paenibacillus donghaensis TaxID=414771 RepID=A0A2Z2K977_9BACL|nr:hypothetical protein [Paenibacillus donghaensis]ASA19935.1 hypothetical protein B9T62_03410 [Paenibacillus donghaensis]
MIQDNLVCKACGSTTFVQGDMSNGYANLMPLDKKFSFGSPLLFTFCKKCGEVASIKVKNTDKF